MFLLNCVCMCVYVCVCFHCHSFTSEHVIYLLILIVYRSPIVFLDDFRFSSCLLSLSCPFFYVFRTAGRGLILLDSFSNPKVSIASQSFFRAGDRWRGGTGGIAGGPSRKRTLDESDVAGNFVPRTCVHLIRTSTEKCEKIDRRTHLYGKEVRYF